eukprot:IDg22645t1
MFDAAVAYADSSHGMEPLIENVGKDNRSPTALQGRDKNEDARQDFSSFENSPRVPTIHVDIDIIKADVRALLRMENLDRGSLIADTVQNRLVRKCTVSEQDRKEIPVDN